MFETLRRSSGASKATPVGGELQVDVLDQLPAPERHGAGTRQGAAIDQTVEARHGDTASRHVEPGAQVLDGDIGRVVDLHGGVSDLEVAVHLWLGDGAVGANLESRRPRRESGR